MKNIRAVASSVVSACRKRGLKQSVVMDVLAKSSGYRSIQCAESSKKPETDVSLEEKIVLRTLLFQSDLDYSLDLPIALFEVAGDSDINAGDPVFEWMWSLTDSGFIRMTMLLLAVNSKVGIMYEYMSQKKLSTEQISAFIEKELPDKLANYIKVESIEGEREMLDVMLQDVATPIYNAIVSYLAFDKKQNIFLHHKDKFVTVQNTELNVSVVVDNDGDVLATYTQFGFEVKNSSMWSKKSWMDDPVKGTELHHVGVSTALSDKAFIDAIISNSANKVSADFAKHLTISE
jgi:hypothetical protein